MRFRRRWRRRWRRRRGRSRRMTREGMSRMMRMRRRRVYLLHMYLSMVLTASGQAGR